MPSGDLENRDDASRVGDQENDTSAFAFISSTLAVMVLIALGKLAGFGEKVVLAYFEGASGSIDAYATALKMSSLLYILVEEIVVPAFLTYYVMVRQKSGAQLAYRFFRRVFLVALGALSVAALLNLELESGDSGGASDGNITSQFTATLDGLGSVGDGAHAAHEFVYVDKLIERAALLAMILTLPPTIDPEAEPV